MIRSNPTIPRPSLKKAARVLSGVLGAVSIMIVSLAWMLFSGIRSERVVQDAIAKGNTDLVPYIAQISETSWDVNTIFRADATHEIFAELRATGQEPDDALRAVYHGYVEGALRKNPFVRVSSFTNAGSGQTRTVYLDSQGIFREEVFEEKTDEYRTRELIASLLRDGEITMGATQKYGDNALVIPYTTTFRVRNGALMGSETIEVDLQEFFKDFEYTTLKNLFVVDNEGHYLWHSNPQKRAELVSGKDSSFFTDYPNAYPDILAGRGQRRIEDSGRFVQVRPIYVAFEVLVDGVVQKINAQNVPNQHRVWIIGYEEN